MNSRRNFSQMQKRHLPTLLLPLLAATACGDLSTEPTRTPTELRVSPEMVRLLTGEAAEFQVELVDENGEVYETIPTWAPPVWSSDRPGRVELSGGTITPVRGGEQTLQVELAGLEATTVLRANPSVLGVSVPMVHITQSVQRAGGDVPVIAGRQGLLRVVVNGDDENYYRPRARATFYHGETPVHSTEMALGEVEGLPTTLIEGDLALSYDAHVPGEILQPGVSVVIEVDPEGVVPARRGSTLRIPEAGTLELEVREVSPFRLTLVPVDQGTNRLRSRFTPTYAAQILRLTNDIFPFAEFDIHVRDPYVTEARLDHVNDRGEPEGWYQLIQEIRFLRLDDGSTRYYYGGFDRPRGANIAGLGYIGYPVAIGMDDRANVIAHEIGHTLNLRHAPCGNPSGPDRSYPYRDGIIGQYGYDRTREHLRDRETYDLMSYCSPIWISDYNYEKVIAYRDTSEFDGASADLNNNVAGEQRTLVILGGVVDGELQLEPALDWKSRVTVPSRGGRYTLEGLDAGGSVIFSLSLEPEALDHAGTAQFLVALPVGMAEPDRLERLRLSGPEGVVERARSSRMFQHLPEVRLDGRVARWNSSAFPLAVVRDPGTGLIRAMSRTGEVALPESTAADFEVLLSDGLATRPARVMQK